MLSLGGGEVVLDDLSFSSSGTSHEEDGLLSLQMHVEQVSETSGVNGGDEDLAEDGLIEMFINWNFAVPESPLVFLDAPVVVVAKTTLGELDLNQRPENSVEFIEHLVVVLTAPDAASVGPHGGENEEGLIDDLLLLFLLLRAVETDHVLVVLHQQSVEDHADGVDKAHGRWRSEVGDLCLVVHVRRSFDVALEATEKDSLCHLVDGGVLDHQ